MYLKEIFVLYCSDFPKESDGILALGMGFFFRRNFFWTEFFSFWTEFFLHHSKGIVVLSLNFPVNILKKVMGV